MANGKVFQIPVMGPRYTRKQKLERKRKVDSGDVPIIGPRESQCGAAAFAKGAPERGICLRCGNYHEQSGTREKAA